MLGSNTLSNSVDYGGSRKSSAKKPVGRHFERQECVTMAWHHAIRRSTVPAPGRRRPSSNADRNRKHQEAKLPASLDSANS